VDKHFQHPHVERVVPKILMLDEQGIKIKE